MHSNLKCPRKWLSLLILQFTSIVGSFLILVGMYLGMSDKMVYDDISVSHIIAFVVLPYLSFVFAQLYWFTAVFVVSSWVSKFTDLCNNIADNDIIRLSKQYLLIYKSLEQHLGSFFFLFFSVSQVIWTSTLYIGVVGYFAQFSAASTICFGAGYAVYSLGISAKILGFSGLLEDAHQSLQGTVKTLEIHSLGIDDSKELLQLSYHIKSIEKTKPLSGKGLFQIDRSIFTGMVSVAFTYIIILVQFRLSFNE